MVWGPWFLFPCGGWGDHLRAAPREKSLKPHCVSSRPTEPGAGGPGGDPDPHPPPTPQSYLIFGLIHQKKRQDRRETEPCYLASLIVRVRMLSILIMTKTGGARTLIVVFVIPIADLIQQDKDGNSVTPCFST